MIGADSRPCGQPTHYTRAIGRSGKPYAVEATAPDAWRPLPEGWDDRFWRWEPAGDPGGQWVMQADEKRADMWARVKAERAKAMAEPAETHIGPVNADAASADELARMVLRMGLPGAPEAVEWTLADNSRAWVSLADLQGMLAAVQDYRTGVHEASQLTRIAIAEGRFDKSEVTRAGIVQQTTKTKRV